MRIFIYQLAVSCCLILLVCNSSLYAQELDSLLDMNAFTEESELQKIINKNVAVSSQKALSTRETPGIISVVTAEDIRNAGARDLSDVLRLIPGFDVLQDLQFVQGIGLRGNWANEGKVLFMLDGQPFNDLLYQTVAIGNHFPIDAIERIEIIRGPGSAIYGGSAEYGVINMITKAASSLNGVEVYGTSGFHADAVGRTNAGVMVASRTEELAWDVSLFKGNGIVSDRKFTPMGSTEEYNLAKVTNADPLNINAGIKYKDFYLRAMYDDYQTSDPTNNISYRSFFGDLRYTVKAGKHLTITPRLRYMHQLPWAVDTLGEDDVYHHYYKTRAERMLGQVDINYSITPRLNIVFGGLYFHDKAADLLETGEFSGSNMFDLNNVAVYAQGLYQHRLFNATVGFRYEKNSRYGAAFVPRIAVTKKIDNLHFKLLYSYAFRAPSIENLNLSGDDELEPEKSNIAELELGYQFTSSMLLSVNAFLLTTKDVIIYGTAFDGAPESYMNYEKSGSKGVEVTYSVRRKNWYTTLTYSYSQAIDDNTVDTYIVPQTKKQYVGFAKSKVTMNTNIQITSKINIDPSFIFVGKRFAYTALDEDDNSVATEIDPYLLVNTFINYKQLFIPGLVAGVGVYDIFNAKPVVAQAYNGGYAPIPGRSREYMVKLSYQLNFNK